MRFREEMLSKIFTYITVIVLLGGVAFEAWSLQKERQQRKETEAELASVAIKEEEKEDAEKKEPAFTFDNPSGDNIFLPVSANSGDGENCLVYTVAYEEDGSHKIELLYEVVLDETGKIARRDRSGEVEWNCIAYQTGEGWKAAKGEE